MCYFQFVIKTALLFLKYNFRRNMVDFLNEEKDRVDTNIKTVFILAFKIFT